jgi:diaminohydroxyphosphoribosylaminopyrimidine deaminase/5-amino-6-(5-phosphoribosylamino)uracil reductase
MSFSRDDQLFMAQALALAERGRYTTRPNPRVGCVLVKEGRVIAEGYHFRCGGAHAEIHALQQLPDIQQAKGATAYVTLEPCSHQGRTGACALAFIDAGLARVVYAMEDPNPVVSGRGLQLLRDAGIHTDGPLLETQARRLNQGFVTRMQQQKPWVRCKMAMSLDGRTAMASGESQWITGAAARRDVQKLRAESGAIITGIGSILQDNSRLSLRADELLVDSIDDVLALPPLRVVLDSQLRIPHDAAIFSEVGAILVVTSQEASVDTEQQLRAQWPNTVDILRVDSGDNGLNLAQVLHHLAERYQCNDVLVEAGATLSGAFLHAGLLNEFVIYQAPLLLGSDARGLVNLPLSTMQDKAVLTITDRRMVGDDQRLCATVNHQKSPS